MSETKESYVSPTIVKNSKKFIKEFLKKEDKKLSFHNYTHATEVAQVAVMLAKKAGIEFDTIEELELAALFHDTGYVKGHEDHESESARIARGFLAKEEYDPGRIANIEKLILSTRLKHASESLEEEILRDADFSHLGRKRFFRMGELLRAEMENHQGMDLSEYEWQKKQYNFLLNNPFETLVARKEYDRRRAKNIKKQREQVVKAKKITRRLQTGKDFGRGIDTLYRANYRSHINFSSIADGKANMMISINTILISIIVTLSGASFSMIEGMKLESLRFTLPILSLLLSSLASVFFAVMSARPKVTNKEISKKEVKRKDVSMLFFGNFLEISQEEFSKYLSELKNNQEELYNTMSMDIYNLGIVLKRKYRLLTISYTVFITGITICVLGFIGIFLSTNVF